jgi:glycosyltransferase involved in cell wall biosynthesis
VSCYVGETTRRLLGLAARPIEVLPNPVDASLFCPRPGMSEEEGLILFVGTVCEKKGIRQLVQAMPRIVEAVPHARLRVVGRDGRDPKTGMSFTDGLRATLSPELAGRVEFAGNVEHAALPDQMARAQVCVYPSHMEALPVAWLEGLAMGKAVVASATGPGPEVIEDGVSGLLCDPHAPASIADRIIALLRDPQLRGRLGARARERAVASFSVETLVTRNEAFYRRCIGGRADA